MSHQRAAKDKMELVRRQALEALPGWTWKTAESVWERGFESLLEFVQRLGHGRVPVEFVSESGYALGAWVTSQRKARARLAADRVVRLNSVRGWTWDVRGAAWDEGFEHLWRHVERVGHARPAATFETENGFRLGRWVSAQRHLQARLSPDRVARLEALPGWVWSAHKGR